VFTARYRLGFLYIIQPSGHYTYHQLTLTNSTFCPHSVFMCFVWIWEKTAIISLYSINWLVFITDRECVYCAVWTGYLYLIQNPQKPSGHYMYHQLTLTNSTFCPHSVFMCFVWIWEQTAIISLYSINWLVCITDRECVYCAVRIGYLYLIQNPQKPSGHYMYHQLTLTNSTFCPHSLFMCFVWIWEQTTIISLYSINWPVFITETECVYCAVRTEHICNSTFYPHSVFMCFVWIWEQTAIISLYSFNWLVFITKTECVYCAVRAGSLYIT